MQRLSGYTIFVILFVCSTTFSQVWFVKNVSNVSLDDCYVSFGDNCGIAYCHPERYLEPQKLEEWDDNALYYVLYPVYPIVMNNDEETEKKSKRRKSRRRKSTESNDVNDSLQTNETPKWKFTTEDSLTLTENGKIFFKFEDILLYKTYKPLQGTDITSYRPFQLLMPSATGLSSDKDR
ncbi:hypothetical protein ACFL5S_00995 [Fibrobacterota bacterium]